jgi:hypothetical protein
MLERSDVGHSSHCEPRLASVVSFPTVSFQVDHKSKNILPDARGAVTQLQRLYSMQVNSRRPMKSETAMVGLLVFAPELPHTIYAGPLGNKPKWLGI